MKLTLRNVEIQFISGIKVTGYTGDTDLIQVWASRSINKSNWQPMGIRCERFDQDTYVMFNNPTNAHDYSLDIAVEDTPLGREKISTTFILAEKFSPQSTESNLKDKTVAFVGCARNIKEQAIKTIVHLEGLKKYFKSSVIGVFENDSTDGTDVSLRELHDQKIIHLIQKTNLDKELPLRTARLSYGRNLLLRWALLHEIDYLCVIDFDSAINEGVLTEGFLSNFALDSVWDAVFPVNHHFYYDIYALRQADFFNYDFSSALQKADASLGSNNALWLHVYSRQMDLRGMAGWLPVDSAFGGVGIYKVDKIRQSKAFYQGLDHEGHEICEHLLFHSMLKQNGARLFINPKFIVGPLTDDYTKNVFPTGIWSPD